MQSTSRFPLASECSGRADCTTSGHEWGSARFSTLALPKPARQSPCKQKANPTRRESEGKTFDFRPWRCSTCRELLWVGFQSKSKPASSTCSLALYSTVLPPPPTPPKTSAKQPRKTRIFRARPSKGWKDTRAFIGASPKATSSGPARTPQKGDPPAIQNKPLDPKNHVAGGGRQSEASS